MAQYVSNGQDPASVTWRQIHTNRFQLIYPADYEKQAQMLMFWLEEACLKVDSSMNSNPRKISVIMHSKTAYSNGMVVWAPRRIELYNSPHQGIDGQEWLKSLAIHEYRHVVQIEKLHQGFTEILSILYGEQATVFPLGLYVPIWFLEGDAVATETALSLGGRGRQPEFLQGFKALTLEKGVQKYDRALLGSYKTYVPNHYEAGYYTVAVNRLQRDPSIFEQKMENIGQIWIWPFGNNVAGLRDGKRKQRYYSYAFNYLNETWQKEEQVKTISEYRSIVADEPDFHDFSRLQYANGRLLAWHRSFDQVAEIVELLPNGSWQTVVTPGGYGDRTYSAQGDRVIWTELRYDARWENRAWSDVYIYNLQTGEKKRLTRKQRLAAPVLSPRNDAELFAAVEADDKNQYTLKLFHVRTGEQVRALPNPENAYLLHPCFSVDGKALVYIKQTEKGKGLYRYWLDESREEELLPPSFVEIGYPSCADHGIYFTGAWTGENNIYFYDDATRQLSRMSAARFGGNFAACGPDSTLAFANYTANGYRPVVLTTADLPFLPVQKKQTNRFPLAEGLAGLEGGAVAFTENPGETYASKPYSKALHLFKFHSWGFPIAVDPVDSRMYAGAYLLSQNMLSTSFLSVGADFVPENALERYYVNYAYEGWYPKLDVSVKFGNDSIMTDYGPYKRFQWALTGNVSVPLTYYQGIYVFGITPAIGLQYAPLTYTLLDDSYTGSVSSLVLNQVNVQPTLSMYRMRQRSVRDLHSRWGQVLQLGYSTDLSEDLNSGALGFVITQLNFPGFFPHHAILIGNNYQFKELGDFSEENQRHFTKPDAIGFPRGEQKFSNHRLYSFTSDYRMPVFYPEWSLGKFLYLKRVNLGLFYDFSRSWLDDYDRFGNFVATNVQDYASTGGSVYFDVNPLRYEFNMRIGVQNGVNLRTQKYFNNIIVSFSL